MCLFFYPNQPLCRLSQRFSLELWMGKLLTPESLSFSPPGVSVWNFFLIKTAMDSNSDFSNYRVIALIWFAGGWGLFVFLWKRRTTILTPQHWNDGEMSSVILLSTPRIKPEVSSPYSPIESLQPGPTSEGVKQKLGWASAFLSGWFQRMVLMHKDENHCYKPTA